MSLDLKGIPEVQRRIAEEVARLERAAGAGVYLVANNIMTEALPLTPLDMGPLRASHYVSHPEKVAGIVQCEVGFGGPAADYAVVQHEDTDLNHPEPGTQAKYLETPLLAAQSGYESQVSSFARAAYAASAGFTPGPHPTTPGGGGAK